MSYRKFLNESLNRDALQEKNRNSPDGFRYCNGLCQDYITSDKFTSTHVICNQCRNIFNIAEQKVNRKQISVEDFRQNPLIIYDQQKKTTTAKKTCHTCHQEKIITQFEYNRQICKSCRFLQQSTKNKENAQNYIKDIEDIKDNIPILENFLMQIPKDTLVIIGTHYGVGRKSTDSKNNMICNIVQHFRSLLNPNLCKAGCGSTVIKNLTVCEKCKKKPPSNRLEREKEFTENLDHFVENLEPMNPKNEIDLYNKHQLCQIARKLDIRFIQSIKKNELFERINQVLIKREEDRQVRRAKEELIKKNMITTQQKFEDLVIDEFRIQARSPDGYINATQLCKAGKKLFADWYRLDNTENLIHALSAETGITVLALVDIKKGGDDKYTQGSWIHPDLAVHLAQWISPVFAVRVSRWVREIVLTGYANFEPKSNEELLKLQLELQENQSQLKRLETNHKNLLQKRDYHKFQNGSCLYIIQADDHHFKIGVSDNLNNRLKIYRTSIPCMKVLYIIYTSKASILEQCLLSRYSDYRVENNHEFLKDISLLDLTESINTLCKFMHFDSNIVPKPEITIYNESD